MTEGNLEYPICKKGSGWKSIGLVWEGGKGNLPSLAALEVELHKLSLIVLRLNPSDSSWKWGFKTWC